MQRITLDERRRVLGRTVLSLVNKSGPLTVSERGSLKRLQTEMEDIEEDIREDAHRKYAGAFRSWLRNGWEVSNSGNGVTAEERTLLREFRDMGTGGLGAGSIGATGGALFAPLQFFAKVEAAMKDIGPMLDLATIQELASGAPRAFPAVNDTTITGEQISEQTQVTDADIAGLVGTTLGSFKYSSKIIKCSMELVTDTGFDIEAWLAEMFGTRIGRIVNTKFTTGVGTTEPFGVLTQATSAGTAAGANTNDGTSGANTLGTDDFATLEASVDPAYRKNGRWMMHANTLASLRKVKDKEGRPVFPGLHSGGEDSIFNKPIALNPNMDQLQTQVGSPPVTRKTLAFGDFSKYTARRTPALITRMAERFVTEGQIGFLMVQRYDGNLIDGAGGAVKTLQNVY
jgi:HK97 family phage major capsid protein